LLNLLAAGMLLISFAMLSTRRTQQLITLFAWQGAILFLSTSLVAHEAGLTELYFSAALTLILKVITLPLILHTLIKRLGVQWDNERLVNIPITMLVGLVLVIFAFGLAQPISLLATTITRHTIGIALAVILLSFLMMITRRKAVTQVIGFLAMENGLFLAATSATYGMPMVIELGIALDLLVAVFILGIFFFQIREQFDSLDLHHLESLKEE
jgi:hydrogenase-4 component E